MDVVGDSYYIDFSTVKVIDDYVHWWEMREIQSYLNPLKQALYRYFKNISEM